MKSPAFACLRKLEATRFNYEPGQADIKLRLLRRLAKLRQKSSDAVLRLHEHLCFLRAYPDNRAVQRQVVAMLNGFSARADLKQFHSELSNTGIAGTTIFFRFFWPSARWIARRWPKQMAIDWEEIDDSQPLASALPILVTPLEANWLRLSHVPPQAAIKKLKGPDTADGTFLVKRIEAMAGDHITHEAFSDGLDVPYRLNPARHTPSRTLTHNPTSPIVFRSVPPERARPNLPVEITRPPRAVETVSIREGERLIDLARVAMATRERDLDNFAYGDANDVRMVDDGDGLQWILIGTLPERRPILRATYGMLTLRNGIPIGYVGADALFRCVDISYNTFPTFRGGEAAYVFSRMLATLRTVFGARTFTIEPYQLGLGNYEGIDSGAWWFYYKLGFRPRNPHIRALVRTELARMKSNPRHRSSATTLHKLAADYLYFEPPGERAPHWPRLTQFGESIAIELGNRSGFDRNAALDQCLTDTVRRLKVGPPAHASKNVLAAWRNWAAVVAQLPGIERWNPRERRQLADVISAKGSRRDTDYLTRFDDHPKLGTALRRQIND